MMPVLTGWTGQVSLMPGTFAGVGACLAWVLGAQNPRGRGVVADLARLRREGGSRQLRLIEVEERMTPFAGLGADAIALSHYNQMREVFYKSRWLRHVAPAPVVYCPP